MSKGMEDITTRKIDDSDEMPRDVFTGSAPKIPSSRRKTLM